MNAIRRATAVVLLAAGAVAGPFGTTEAIENGEIVPQEDIGTTGAVLFGSGEPLCSGVMITPRWALTAGHCGVLPGTRAILGNFTQQGAPFAKVEESFAHPLYGDYDYGGYDARLVRLDRALYPRYPGGRLWELYKRDLYRGDVWELVGHQVEVYGFGATHDGLPTDTGTLRLGRFTVDDVDDERLFYDDDARLWGGDSGAGVLVADQSGRYSIVAVHSGSYWVPFDIKERGAHAASIAPWFDSLVGDELRAFKAPSLILNTIIGAR